MNRGFFVFRDKGKTNIYIQLKASQGCNARVFLKKGWQSQQEPQKTATFVKP